MHESVVIVPEQPEPTVWATPDACEGASVPLSFSATLDGHP